MANQPPPEARSLDKFADGVSALSYVPNQERSLLASTSWDGAVRVHDTAESSPLLSQTMDSGPLLALTPMVTGEGAVVTGGLDGSVRMLDIATSALKTLGQHESEEGSTETSKACSCLGSFGGDHQSLVASASWSKKLYLWDSRQSTAVARLDLPGKAFAMDIDRTHNRIVVATSGRKNCFVDIRQGKPEIVLERDSSLKFQTRCVQFFPDGRGIALGSVEGRVGVEFLDELGVSSAMKKYAFKCHRVGDTVYPVNCISFHPRFQSVFATGGCDGSVVLWDGTNKKKLTTLPSFPTSISALAFSNDGSEMAVASSYTFEEGDREHPQDEVFVRKILDSECIPKAK